MAEAILKTETTTRRYNMSERYENIILKAKDAEQNVFFELEKEEGILIIRVSCMMTPHEYSENYSQPIIPEGFKYVEGSWETGLVIEREKDESQFVWIPVGNLERNATIDGKNFVEKFGRRRFLYDYFNERGYSEELTQELREQLNSVIKYGGFYISRFNISMGKDGKLHSTKGAKPCVKCNFYKAKELSKEMIKLDDVTSHLIYGSEFDSVIEWLIESGTIDKIELLKNSTRYGNYRNSPYTPKYVMRTGACERWKMNNLYDFAGNVKEWTQESYNLVSHVIRGGCAHSNGEDSPACYRDYMDPRDSELCVGFRVALCIK